MNVKELFSIVDNHAAPARILEKLTSKPSILLSDKSNKLLFSLLADFCVSLTTTVAGLCERSNGQWEFLGKMGVCFEFNTLSHKFYLRFYSLEKRKMAREVPVPSVGIDLRFDSSPDFGRLSHYDRKVHAIYGLQFVPDQRGRAESRELQQALFRQNVAHIDKLKMDAVNRTREIANAATGKDRFTKSALDDKVKAELENIRNSSGGKEPSGGVKASNPDSKSESKLKRIMRRKKKSEDDKAEKPKISPKDIGMPTDLRHVQHIGVDKKSEIQHFDLAKDPEMNYLLEQMGIRYEEVLQRRRAQRKLDELIYGQGGIEKFKAELKQNGISSTSKANQTEVKSTSQAATISPTDSRTILSPPIMTSTPIGPHGTSIQKTKETESNLKRPAEKETAQSSHDRLRDSPPSSPGRGLMRIPPPPMRDLMSDIRAFEAVEEHPKSLAPIAAEKTTRSVGGNEHYQMETVESPFLANLESSLFEIHQIIAQPDNHERENSGSADSSTDPSSEDFGEEDESGQDTR